MPPFSEEDKLERKLERAKLKGQERETEGCAHIGKDRTDVAVSQLDTRLDKIELTPEAMKRTMKIHMLAMVRQHQINKVNSQLHSMNFLMGYSNALKTKDLHKGFLEVKHCMEEGQVVLTSLQNTLATQSSAIVHLERGMDGLADEVQSQGELTKQISSEMHKQRIEFKAALEDVDYQLASQQSLIQDQEKSLQRLMKVRFRIDFVVDMVILLLSWWGSTSRVVGWLLNPLASSLSTLSSKSMPEDRLLRSRYRYQVRSRSRTVSQLMQLSMTAVVFRYLKTAAVNNGLHSLVGSINTYGAFVTDLGTNFVGHLGLPVSYINAIKERGESLKTFFSGTESDEPTSHAPLPDDPHVERRASDKGSENSDE